MKLLCSLELASQQLPLWSSGLSSLGVILSGLWDEDPGI